MKNSELSDLYMEMAAVLLSVIYVYVFAAIKQNNNKTQSNHSPLKLPMNRPGRIWKRHRHDCHRTPSRQCCCL